jgi:flagellar biosynthesis protein FlhF
MQIKRFEARDMTTALRLIKNELGPEAVILSARNIKKAKPILGLAKSVGVEVTAAVDAYHLPIALNSASSDAGELNGYRRRKPINGSKKGNLKWSFGTRAKTITHRKQAAQGENHARFENNAVCADVFQHLLSQEVNREIANEITDTLTRQYQDNRFETKAELVSKISIILSRKMSKARVPLSAQTNSQVMAFIGPTGVGKTTTVAKLAAKHAVELKKKVALISLNEFRKFDFILVDTPGLNPGKQDEINALKAYLDCDASISVHLVLSAGSKESDLFNTLRRLNTLAVHKLIFTKLDESRTYGNLINLLMKHPLSLSFLTNSREVPGAIESGSLERIVECVFGGFTNSSAFSSAESFNPLSLKESTRGEDGYFVANKNSDVFHHPDCKWAQKIKSKNRITFSNIQAAQEKHFMPCRDCQPLKNDEVNSGLSVDDRVRISNYL